MNVREVNWQNPYYPLKNRYRFLLPHSADRSYVVHGPSADRVLMAASTNSQNIGHIKSISRRT